MKNTIADIRAKKPCLSQHKAIRHFIDMGFVIYDNDKHINANGQDFTAAKNGKTYRVEVKSVVKSSRSMVVKNVTRKSDDLIAMVHENIVIVQLMKDHLRLCSKDGSRGVTGLFKLHKQMIFEQVRKVDLASAAQIEKLKEMIVRLAAK